MVTSPHCLKTHLFEINSSNWYRFFSLSQWRFSRHTAPQDTYLNPPLKAGADSEANPNSNKSKRQLGDSSVATAISVSFLTLRPGTIPALWQVCFLNILKRISKGSDLQDSKCLLTRHHKGNSHMF